MELIEKFLKVLFSILFMAMIVSMIAVSEGLDLDNKYLCPSLLLVFWGWLFVYVRRVDGYSDKERLALKQQVWLVGMIILCNLYAQNQFTDHIFDIRIQTVSNVLILVLGIHTFAQQVFCIPLGRKRMWGEKDYKPPTPAKGPIARLIGLLLIGISLTFLLIDFVPLSLRLNLYY